MDPHLTERSARYQAARVAAARGMASADVEALIDAAAFYPAGLASGERIVNVLRLNLLLDDAVPVPGTPRSSRVGSTAR
jgi:K+-transporting ATPase ATPase C chain